jgi:hypothetical protein
MGSEPVLITNSGIISKASPAIDSFEDYREEFPNTHIVVINVERATRVELATFSLGS